VLPVCRAQKQQHGGSELHLSTFSHDAKSRHNSKSVSAKMIFGW